jgi:hypothetical protein
MVIEGIDTPLQLGAQMAGRARSRILWQPSKLVTGYMANEEIGVQESYLDADDQEVKVGDEVVFSLSRQTLARGTVVRIFRSKNKASYYNKDGSDYTITIEYSDKERDARYKEFVERYGDSKHYQGRQENGKYRTTVRSSKRTLKL